MRIDIRAILRDPETRRLVIDAAALFILTVEGIGRAHEERLDDLPDDVRDDR
jgi:hypothetical protein